MRSIRVLWLLVFILPLGFFADRLCYIDIVDPTYHTMLWMNERLGYLFAALAVVSASLAFARFIRIQGQLRALDTLASAVPPHIRTPFADAATKIGLHRYEVVYIDVSLVFCFTVFGGRIIISRGFADLLGVPELRLVAIHEVLHVKAGDPVKALLWHLFFAALIVPGFESLEEALYQRRERRVDCSARKYDEPRYTDLLARFSLAMCRSTPSAAFRALDPPKGAIRPLLPTAVPVSLLLLLALNHLAFVQNLTYLQTHHC